MENKIENFTKIRADGNIIYDYMSVTDIKWEPCKIQTVEWEYDGRLVRFDETPETGIAATFLKDKDIVVFAQTVGEKEAYNNLTVYNPDGTVRFTIPNKILIFGEEKEGEFLWLPDSKYVDANHFVVIFAPFDSNRVFKILVNSDTGETEFLSEARQKMRLWKTELRV